MWNWVTECVLTGSHVELGDGVRTDRITCVTGRRSEYCADHLGNWLTECVLTGSHVELCDGVRTDRITCGTGRRSAY
jgi:hypothetical protein